MSEQTLVEGLPAILSQQIGGGLNKFGYKIKIPAGTAVTVLWKEAIRGSYRKKHRTPFLVDIPGYGLAHLSRNSFTYIEKDDSKNE